MKTNLTRWLIRWAKISVPTGALLLAAVPAFGQGIGGGTGIGTTTGGGLTAGGGGATGGGGIGGGGIGGGMAGRTATTTSGTAAARTGTGAAAGTQIPSASNPWTYVDPLSMGIGSKVKIQPQNQASLGGTPATGGGAAGGTGGGAGGGAVAGGTGGASGGLSANKQISVAGTFATPLYTQASGTTTNVGGAQGQAQNANAANANSFNTFNVRKNPQYSTMLGPTINMAPKTNLSSIHADLQQSLDNSVTFTGNKNLVVEVRGDSVALKGQVDSADARRIAEGILRTTPGVRNVINEVSVVPPSKNNE